MLGPKGTAPIIPGTNMNILNELIRFNVFEKVGSNRVRPTDEFIRVYNEVGPARYSEIESPSRNDEVMALFERVKLVLSKLAAEQEKVIDDKKLNELSNDTTKWITIIQQTDVFRQMR